MGEGWLNPSLAMGEGWPSNDRSRLSDKLIVIVQAEIDLLRCRRLGGGPSKPMKGGMGSAGRGLRQLGDIRPDRSRLVFAEQLGRGSSLRLILEIDVRELLSAAVRAGVQFLQGGGKRGG
jgi:hypothetical protein